MKIFFNMLITLFFLLRISSGWALPECEGSPYKGDDLSKTKFWNNCVGTHTLNIGNKYVVEWKDGMPHKGTAYYLEDNQYKGDKYVGEFKYGKMHGQGVYNYAIGTKYVGEFKDGERYEGTYTYANGDKYVGQWKDDKLNGQGTYTYTSGHKYVGEYRDNKRHGHFVATYPNGSRYIGEFKNNMRHGKGKYTHIANDKFKGYIHIGEY